MFIELLKIAGFILQSIIHVWPYLLISVPIAVAVRLSGASKYISRVFSRSPFVSILLATLLGALSPFCSCSVIPIIASLLIGGVPLAPVMSFWLASPSMDPEMFFLSVSVLGWQLALWRLASTFAMSLISGLVTHYLVKRKWIRENETLKAYSYSPIKSSRQLIKEYFIRAGERIKAFGNTFAFAESGIPVVRNENVIIESTFNSKSVCCNVNESAVKDELKKKSDCCGINEEVRLNEDNKCGCNTESRKKAEESFSRKLSRETFKASYMVVKFMILAYFLEALIVLYVPDHLITSVFAGNSIVSIFLAALIGVPVYTSTMPALALVGGLISKGMAPAAGLAFLISGPTTTIPAMAAVWNLASRKVFILYVGFTLAFAILSGLVYYAVYSVF